MHYSLAIISKDGDYERVLKPYSELLPVAPHLDRTRQQLIDEYRTSLKNAKNNPSYEKYLKNTYNFSSDKALIRSIKESYKDDPTLSFDDNDNMLTTYNPLSLYDWYELGGRYGGTLRLNDSVKKKSFLYDCQECEDGTFRSSHAQVKHIDLMATCAVDNDTLQHLSRFWDVFVDEKPLEENEDASDFDSIWHKEYYKRQYQTKQNFLNSQTSFPSYAIIAYGTIYAPPTDDLFNFANINPQNKKRTYAEYLISVSDVLSKLEPNDWVSIVDCHI